MIEETLYYPSIGKVKIKSFDISYLFTKHKLIYKKIFKLNEEKFYFKKKFKEMRGGLFFEITNNEGLIAFFTLSNGVNNFLEFGDVIKVNPNFLRKFFSEIIDIACKKITNLLKKNGIYSYPNKYSTDLLLLANFKVFKNYKKNIYLTFLNLKFLLPFKICKEKIDINLKYFLKFPLSLNKDKLEITGLKKFGLNVYKKNSMELNTSRILNFGFIYEYELSNNEGDPFIIFGADNFPKRKINFESTDNSA
jgi:hypothetical protein